MMGAMCSLKVTVCATKLAGDQTAAAVRNRNRAGVLDKFRVPLAF
jgi:hypothetical protein